MHSFLFSLLLVVFRSRRAVFYPQIFLKSLFLACYCLLFNLFVNFYPVLFNNPPGPQGALLLRAETKPFETGLGILTVGRCGVAGL